MHDNSKERWARDVPQSPPLHARKGMAEYHTFHRTGGGSLRYTFGGRALETHVQSNMLNFQF